MKNAQNTTRRALFPLLLILICHWQLHAQQLRVLEDLDRGLIAMQRSNDIYLSWRMFGLEPTSVAYHVYRDGVKITSTPISTSTNYVDVGGTVNSMYAVSAVVDGQEGTPCPAVSVWKGQPAVTGYESKPAYPFKSIKLPTPPTDPEFADVVYVPGDMNVGDLDGDGDYELVFQWESGDGNDTHLSFLDAIDLDGKLLWRINAGRNCDKLAHMVYDLDMDGKAEVAFKSAPGTKDGLGNYLSDGPAATDNDLVLLTRSAGRLYVDPAYLTIVDGLTGAEKRTISYPFNIGANGGLTDGWGDDYGHRASSIKACVIWVQGTGPLLVYTRGIYARMAMRAYKWDGVDLTTIWTFDTKNPLYTSYQGEGNHSLSVGDVDNDGSDEIIYGACAVNHDGTGMYATGRGHGDADHLADHDPDRPGLEFFQPHENSTYGISMRDAATGAILWEYLSPADIGRAYADDFYAEYRGSEVAAITFPNYDKDGNEIPKSLNPYFQPVYWDGDVQRELRNGNTIDAPDGRLLTAYWYGAESIHDSKKDANLVADILGDWREEIIWKKSNTELLIFSTTIETTYRNYTLMHDAVYRMNIVRQNIGYNQPAHTGYFFADGAPVPSFTTPDLCATPIIPYLKVNSGSWQAASSVTIDVGSSVKFGPQPRTGGSWRWSGCGTSGTSREQTVVPGSSCIAVATYKNSSGCVSSQEFKVVVNGLNNITTGVENTVTEDSKIFNLYPNPATQHFTIDLADHLHDAKYRIVNAAGVVVMSGSLEGDKRDINISQLPSGLYVVLLEVSLDIYAKTIIVK